MVSMRPLFDYKTCRVLSLVWMAIIFLLSSIPRLSAPSLFSGQDKLIHFVIFGILGFLFAHSFKPGGGKVPFFRALLITLMVAMYGGFDEIHQYFIPGRVASMGDVAADTAGGFLAAIIFWKN